MKTLILILLLLVPAATIEADTGLAWKIGMLAGSVIASFMTVKLTQKADSRRITKLEKKQDEHEKYHQEKDLADAEWKGEITTMIKVIYDKHKS